jgi:hypothetical protein
MQTAPAKEKGRHATNAATLMQNRPDSAPVLANVQTSTHLTPRRLRLLTALLDGPCTREEVDRIVGASNGPDEVLRARRLHGLVIPCERSKGFDRDQHRVEFGIYRLTSPDKDKARSLVIHALAQGVRG